MKLYLPGETVEGLVTLVDGTATFLVEDADGHTWAGTYKSTWRKIA